MMRLVTVGLLSAALLTPLGGAAHRKTEKGNELFEQGQFDEALRAYTDAQVDAPDSPELSYNIGNVLYRQGDFQGAAEAFTRALLSGSEQLVPKTAHNLGNARFQQEEYDEALKAYERALRAAPDDLDSKRNLELVLRALQQQEPPPPNDEPGEGEQQPQPAPSPRPEPSSEGEDGQEPPPGSPQEPAPEGMTPEQAAQLLDGAGDQELEALRQERSKSSAPDRTPEKDW
jgi:Ca-activated chloride channel family protein